MKNKNFKDLFFISLAVCLGMLIGNNLLGVIKSVCYYIAPVFYGIVSAYLAEPVIKGIENKLFRNKNKKSWYVSIGLFFIGLVILFLLLSYLIIPMVLISYNDLITDIDDHMLQIKPVFGFLIKEEAGIEFIINKMKTFLLSFGDIAGKKSGDIVHTSLNIFISCIMAVYFLADSRRIKKELKVTLKLFIPAAHMYHIEDFFSRCNQIFANFIICELLDAVLVSVINGVAMYTFNIPYVLLVTIVAGITNLIPTFGPMIGLIAGFFIIFLSDPVKALIFVIIVAITQATDAYIIKPRLFGNTLGLSGFLVLASVIVGQRTGGIIGMLLAMPAAAICKIIWTEWIRPWLYFNKKDTDSWV